MGGFNFGGGGFNFEDFFGGGGGFGGGGSGFHFNMGGGGPHGGPKRDSAEEFFAQSDVELINIQTVTKFYRRNQVWILFFFKSDDEKCKKIRDEFKVMAEKMYGVV